jgi:phage portal protein BeeE
VIFKSKNVQTMTMPAIMKSVMTDVLLKGAGYILIERGVTGIVTALRYLPYGSVSVMYNEYNDTLSYIVSLKISDTKVHKSKVSAKDIIHITRVTRDGVNGQSVMQFAKNSADLAKTAELSA